MKLTFSPQGVCAKMMTVEVEDGIITSVQVMGGCSGNSQGIVSLLKGMPVEQAIDRLEGIRCGGKPTSCPDQLAQGMKRLLEEHT